MDSLNRVFLVTFLGCAVFFAPVWVSAQHHQLPAQEALSTGITLYENGQFEQAISFFDRFIAHPDTDQQFKTARYYTALAQAALDPDRTLLFFDSFITDFPNSAEAGNLYADLGHRNFQDGSFRQASVFYERALALNLPAPFERQVLYWNAQTHVELSDFERAHYFLEQIHTKHQNTESAAEALFTRGRLYLDSEEYELAAEMFELLRRGYPLAAVTEGVGTALGEAYYRQGRFEEAVNSLRTAYPRLNREQQSKAAMIMAESFSYLGDLESASTWYRTYIRLNEGGDVRLAHYGLGWVFHRQQVFHWAADSFNRAVSTADDDLSRRALYYKAVNHKLSGRYDLAVQTFETFANRFSTGPWVEQAYFEWALILAEIGDHVSAIERLLYVVRNLQPLQKPGEVYSLLGEAYFANAEYRRAIEAFQQAEAAGTVTPEVQLQARFQRGWVLFRNRAWDEAQPVFESVFQATPTSDLGSEALFWSADSYFNMEEFGPAAIRFARYIREFPNGEFAAAARYSLGWSYFMMGDFEQAIPPLIAFLDNFSQPDIAVFPYDIDAQLRIADAKFALRRFDDAIAFYERSLAFDRSADYATYQIATSFYRDERTFEAVRTFRELIEDFPQSPFREQAQYSIGYIYLLSGNYTQAAEEFGHVIRRFPRSQWAPRAQFNIGNAYFNAQEFEQAIAAYQRVLERFPQSDLIIEAVNGIQFAQQSAGMPDTSNDILEAFLAGNPQAGTADQLRFRQALSLLETADYEEAITSFRQYIRVTNNERRIPEALLRIAEAHRALGQTEKAKEAYRTITDEYTNARESDVALLELGNLYLEGGEFNSARQTFSMLLEGSRRMQFEANVGLGKAALGLGQVSEAQARFEAASRLSGNQALVKLGLGRVAYAQQDFRKAAEIFKEVSDSNTGEAGAEAQFRHALSLQRQNLHTDALREFGNVRIFFGAYTSWVAEAMLGAITSNLAVGNRTEAEQIGRIIREEYPGSSYAQRAQTLLR
ncbi:MAG: tetratricopeptide repeat protein [Balneolales bacterium]|nr:tetratricopeptide repeat protein [Balneolales bacterium]